MRTYSFDNIGKNTKYEHLYKLLKADILSGILHSGEKLPSKRSFAHHLNISVLTVENAYAQLIAEGYIYAKPRSGYYICKVERPIKLIDKNVAISTKNSCNVTAPFIIDLVSSRTNPEQFPFATWVHLMRTVITQKKAILLEPTDGVGAYSLREAIANHLEAFRGMKITPEQVVIGAGTEYLYGLLIQLLGHEKVYAVEDPGYPKINAIYQAHGVKSITIAMDNCGLDIDLLRKTNAQILHLSPSHHFPTGMVMPVGRRYALLNWAAEYTNRFIIEDDYDSEFRLSGTAIDPLYSMDENDRVIYLNTFTRSLTPTIRISYMILPMNLIHTFHSKLGIYSCTVSNFEQYTLTEFIQQGYFEKHINRMRTEYRSLRNKLIESLKKSSFSNRIQILEEKAGVHFILKVNTEKNDQELIEALKKVRIQCASLSEYYHNTPHKPTHKLILNYSSLKSEDIPILIAQLNIAFSTLI